MQSFQFKEELLKVCMKYICRKDIFVGCMWWKNDVKKEVIEKKKVAQ